MHAGDAVYLFSFTVGEEGEYSEEVRLFKNGIDPSSLDPGMGGGSFSNTFRIGNSGNIHNSSSEESCIITSVDEKASLEASKYPNPFQGNITIELPLDAKSVQVIDTNGNIYYTIQKSINQTLIIPTTQYPNGI